MSVKAMAAAFQVGIEYELLSTERLVLLCLADHANEAGECFPRMTKIAEKTGVGRRRVNEIVARLVELGLLERRPRFYPEGGGQRSNIYRLLYLSGGTDAGLKPGVQYTARGSC